MGTGVRGRTENKIFGEEETTEGARALNGSLDEKIITKSYRSDTERQEREVTWSSVSSSSNESMWMKYSANVRFKALSG